MKQWLDECLRDHHACNVASRSRGQRLPKRVLNIGTYDGDPVSLYESHSEQAPYVALSHCWGPKDDANILRCTSATKAGYKRRIPWERLPNTFRDAITITRLLGIQLPLDRPTLH
jgi:hypothetical protein